MTTLRQMGFDASKCSKVIGAALNYRVKPTDPAPKEPVFFLKAPSSLVREGNSVVIPKIWSVIHTEVELGVVIGKQAKNIEAARALDYVAGYVLTLDLANMDWQAQLKNKGFPWAMAKSFDTGTPYSRLFIPKNELDINRANILLQLDVNGSRKHYGPLKGLIFSIEEQIEYLTKIMTLEPNDLILSGTPPGVTAIKHGDSLEAKLISDEKTLICMKFQVENEK
ncbi:hypothetical protein ACOME3_005530 [Neoechinorhynchus agilis]